MRNHSIEALKPGFYLILGMSRFFIEKDSNGVVHQLTFAGVRDGELDAEGWNRGTTLDTVPIWEPKR